MSFTKAGQILVDSGIAKIASDAGYNLGNRTYKRKSDDDPPYKIWEVEEDRASISISQVYLGVHVDGNEFWAYIDFFWLNGEGKITYERNKGKVKDLLSKHREWFDNKKYEFWGKFEKDGEQKILEFSDVDNLEKLNTFFITAPTRMSEDDVHKDLLDLFKVVIKEYNPLEVKFEKDVDDWDMEKINYSSYITLLKDNHNLILHGAPGTGKTFLAKDIAATMMFGKNYESLTTDEQKKIGFVQFHPSYDYTDFVEGLRPCKEEGAKDVSFKRKDGIFKSFCKRALLSTNDSNVGIESINENSVVWKVSLKGTGDNDVRKDCVENGYIRIGWKSYGNVDDFENFDGYQKELGGKNVLVAFQNRMKPGDIVVSCYSEKETDAIGVVTGDYEYRENAPDHPRYREVKWILKKKLNILELNKNKKFTLLTVYRMDVTPSEMITFIKNNLDAEQQKQIKQDMPKVFVIDEINRGDMSKIFGELFYSIDPGYRGRDGLVPTQYQNLVEKNDDFKDGFFIPKNVYIIGTMNDIDRSVESMDFAMRRRFVFEEVTAEQSAENFKLTGAAKDAMSRLNAAISKVPGLNSSYHIGAAYFKDFKEGSDLEQFWNRRLKGLLTEYLRGTRNATDELEKLKEAFVKKTASEPTDLGN